MKLLKQKPLIGKDLLTVPVLRETQMLIRSSSATGLFDQAFTETAVDYADFNAAADAKWYRIEGGMQRLTDGMVDLLESKQWPKEKGPQLSFKVNYNNPVVAMADEGDKISVTVKGQKPEKYDAVFSTTAMGPLQRMDLEGLKLPRPILRGIRSLSYDRATKVAIKFKKPWWFEDSDLTKIFGGISSTDLPISKVVYPSWNDGPDKPAVLMVSYSWAQDATRMGSLTPDYTKVKPSKDDEIVRVCFEALAKLWRARSGPSVQDLYDMYVDHHAWAWSHDPWTAGAFALFGPGQYKDIYPKFRTLFCDYKLGFVGEALSAHHAWISGAFDSAYVRLWLFLECNKLLDAQNDLKESHFGRGSNEHPGEEDEMLAKWAAYLSPVLAAQESSKNDQAAPATGVPGGQFAYKY